ncbi:hypothetical protein HPB52_003651 [Rhipicephalus sanguineus]|uniref:F-box domain-containing protein n=1 Tax=Rhipicephalus sanguineus TaxID=34632 RepID=A0A9D4Q8V8_RHISA|nr:hypothetical protein HPB52_003651 [Rhipicephalus sanguineus]
MSSPSSPAAPRPTHTVSDFEPRLPNEIWMKIFGYLDFQSLLNVALAAPEWKRLTFSPAVTRSVTFGMETNERTLKNFRMVKREKLPWDKENEPKLSSDVRKVHFTNCVALPHEAITDVDYRCRHLRELYCVNCVVEPFNLFRYLSSLRVHVYKVEWTLYDERYYKYQDSLDVEPIDSFYRGVGPVVHEMYVELVRSDASVLFLNSFVRRCWQLCQLHIHDVRTDRAVEPSADAVTANFAPDKNGPLEITDHLRYLHTFKYSCEMQLSPNAGARLAVIRNNIACQLNYVGGRKPKLETTFNVVALVEAVKQKVSLRGFDQVTVVLRGNLRAADLFEEAASKPELWKHVTRLTFVYAPPAQNQDPIPPSRPRDCEKPLKLFFETCVSQLTELNLSTSHFSIGSDCSHLVASTLHRLRSLSLPPCGANRKYSLAWLAEGCKQLECLDVRSVATVDNAEPCKACKRPLLFSVGCFEFLHRETRLRRLSIDETAQIINLKFLFQCRVQELRISVDNVARGDFAQCPKVLGRLLSLNPRLSSLTLVAREATIDPCLAETFVQVQSLRHLCVLSTTSGCAGRAGDFFKTLDRGLPELVTAHAHYVGSEGIVEPVTWMRLRRPWRAKEMPVSAWPTDGGVILYDTPCLGRLCCVDDFTGLVRPRNRH